MKRSEIYRKAAKYMDARNRGYICPTLEFVFASPDCLQHFTDHMKPIRLPRDHVYSGWFGWSPNDQNRDRRVLALLFMAAIAESEGQ